MNKVVATTRVEADVDSKYGADEWAADARNVAVEAYQSLMVGTETQQYGTARCVDKGKGSMGASAIPDSEHGPDELDNNLLMGTVMTGKGSAGTRSW